MSVERIFQQLHDPTSWPAPPERPLRPYSADLRPGVLFAMPVETVRQWLPGGERVPTVREGAKQRTRPCG